MRRLIITWLSVVMFVSLCSYAQQLQPGGVFLSSNGTPAGPWNPYMLAASGAPSPFTPDGIALYYSSTNSPAGPWYPCTLALCFQGGGAPGPYLPLAGGTMTGTFTGDDTGTWGASGINDPSVTTSAFTVNALVNPTTAVTGVGSGSGGTVAANTYYAVCFGFDSVGQHTSPSPEVATGITTTGSTSSILWTCPTVANGTYQVWTGTSSGGENSYFNSPTATYTQTTTTGTSGTLPVNSSQQARCAAGQLPVPCVVYSGAVIGESSPTGTSAWTTRFTTVLAGKYRVTQTIYATTASSSAYVVEVGSKAQQVNQVGVDYTLSASATIGASASVYGLAGGTIFYVLPASTPIQDTSNTVSGSNTGGVWNRATEIEYVGQ